MDIQLTPLDQLLNADRPLSARDVISSLIHAMEIASDIDPTLDKIYTKYLCETYRQNDLGWPKALICNNAIKKRIEICKMREEFFDSDNVLTLLHRLVYLEDLKTGANDTKQYTKALDRVVVRPLDLKECTVDDLVVYTRYALSSYNVLFDMSNVENALANTILSIL